MTTEYLTLKQAMQYMGFNSYDSLRKAVRSGLPVVKFSGSKRISKTAIDEFMKAHTVVTKGEVNHETTI